MSWGRLDDRLDDNPKFAGIDPAAAGLWLLCQPQALRRGDGFVPEGVPQRFIKRNATRIVAVLVVRGLWDEVDGGWVYHDFETYSKLRDTRSEAGSKGAKARWQNDGKPMANHASRDGSPEPVPVPRVAKATTPKPPPGAVGQVFTVWQESTGRSACKLDDKRRRIIAARLADYPLEDVLDAVRGWERDPWEGRRANNEIAILLRDAAHLEKFRDLWRRPSVVTKSPEARVGTIGGGSPLVDAMRNSDGSPEAIAAYNALVERTFAR
jgi:hypothetical protein